MQMINVVLDEDTSKLMEMIHIMKNPKCRELWGKLYGNKLGCLAQGIPGRVEGTDIILVHRQKSHPQGALARRDIQQGCCKLQTGEAES